MCKHLGYAHPDHLLDELTSEQVSEWIAYDQLDPIGTWREDYRHAALCSLITNFVRSIYGKKGQVEFTKYSEFMPEWDAGKRYKEEVKEQTVEEQKAAIMRIADAFGRKEKRKK